MLPSAHDRVYLRVSPLALQARVTELRERQAQLRQRIEEYLTAVGTPLRPGAFEDHAELLAALGRGPSHFDAQRMQIAVEIAALVHGLHAALREATPLEPDELAAHPATVYVLPAAEGRAARALADIRQLLVRWANRWTPYQSAAAGPPA